VGADRPSWQPWPGNATLFHYPAGAFLFRLGEPAAHVLVVTAGQVALVTPVRGGGEQGFEIVGAGQLIGAVGLLTDGRRTLGARALSPVTAWAIGPDPFWAFVGPTPAALALLRQLAERLAVREGLIGDLLSLDVKSRLAKTLLVLAEQYGEPSPDGGIRIAVPLTPRDLAGRVGASRENVSRALGAFRRRGFVDFDARSVRLLDLEALRRLT
jgi:CRP/FNR family transcriptional regulator, cyclic AMP receptor protein